MSEDLRDTFKRLEIEEQAKEETKQKIEQNMQPTGKGLCGHARLDSGLTLWRRCDLDTLICNQYDDAVLIESCPTLREHKKIKESLGESEP